MKFHEFETLYSILNRAGLNPAKESFEDFSIRMIKTFEDKAQLDVVDEINMEFNWGMAGRPYYHLYPFVAESLVKSKLEVPGQHFIKSVEALPPEIQVSLPVGSELSLGTKKVRTFLVQRVQMEVNGNQDLCNGVFLMVDVGERKKRGNDETEWNAPVYNRVCVPLTTQTVFEEYENLELEGQDQDDREITKICLKLYVALSMLVDDPEMVKPDVLAADRGKYEDAKTVAQRITIVERARRRGKNGWIVGKDVEFAPHIRRSHFAIRWMGHGDDKTPVLRPIKAAVVKRKSITEIPTGYLDEEQEQLPGALD